MREMIKKDSPKAIKNLKNIDKQSKTNTNTNQKEGQILNETFDLKTKNGEIQKIL